MLFEKEKRIGMKWIYFTVACLLFNACTFFEEEPEVLLSKIDGEEYMETLEGEMAPKKAYLYLMEDHIDSVDYNIKLDIIDSLEVNDSIWRKKHLKSTSKILEEIYEGDNKQFIEDKIFSFFIHFPNELINHLNNDGFDKIETWMIILNKGLVSATAPEDITTNSVANAAISNCNNCSKEKQKLIVEFIQKLSYFK